MRTNTLTISISIKFAKPRCFTRSSGAVIRYRLWDGEETGYIDDDLEDFATGQSIPSADLGGSLTERAGAIRSRLSSPFLVLFPLPPAKAATVDSSLSTELCSGNHYKNDESLAVLTKCYCRRALSRIIFQTPANLLEKSNWGLGFGWRRVQVSATHFFFVKDQRFLTSQI